VIPIPLPLPRPWPRRVTVRLDPRQWWFFPALLGVLIVALGLWLLGPTAPDRPGRRPLPPAPDAADAAGYLFCTWNVENLFDDEDDPSNADEVEDWFGRNPLAAREKVDLLAQALRARNGGLGPDILVVVEVENRRAAELLRDALNAGLPPERRYGGLVHRDNRSGRRIEPAVLTRLPVRDDLTRDFAPLRILEAHLEGPGHAPLVVLASHWTSRLRDGSDARREVYADALYRAVGDLLRSDPEADVVIAGDFNDEPGDPSVARSLHAVADPGLVRDSLRRDGPLLLLDLTARLDPETDGTYHYNGRWQVLDHIVAAPGLLDPPGWVVRPETLRVENGPGLRTGRDGRPWRFGGPTNRNPRGPSDHFAVTVRMTVTP
jgi:hypothetical protein